MCTCTLTGPYTLFVNMVTNQNQDIWKSFYVVFQTKQWSFYTEIRYANHAIFDDIFKCAMLVIFGCLWLWIFNEFKEEFEKSCKSTQETIDSDNLSVQQSYICLCFYFSWDMYSGPSAPKLMVQSLILKISIHVFLKVFIADERPLRYYMVLQWNFLAELNL